MLEPGWVSANHERFNVFHVHFGFDAVGPDALDAVVDELRSHRKPLDDSVAPSVIAERSTSKS